MPKTVLIILAAVVALIAIVVITGMRYLRADDEDDFDDDVPAEHGRPSSRGNHLPQEGVRSRRHHDDGMPDERVRERPGARVGAGQGDEREPEHRPAGRATRDRGWGEDSGQHPRASRAPLSQREQRQARRPSRRDLDDRDLDDSEQVSASPRSGRSQPGRGSQRGIDDFDGRTARMPAMAREYEREGMDARDGRDRRDSRDGRDRRDSRPGASIRDIAAADRDDRDRRSSTRPNARPESRKNGSGQGEGDELLPAVKPRQGRGKRDSDGDWPSNEWDELSDVDYWAELASDKPFTAAGQPTGQSARSDRGDSRQPAAAGPARSERQESPAGREQLAKRPSRPSRQAEPLVPPAARKSDLAATGRSEDFSSTAPRRASLGGASLDGTEHLQAVPPSRDSRPAARVDDDDPLTSPSFPRIAADDSRSYRRSRTAAADGRQSASRDPDGTPQRSAHGGHTQPQQRPAHPVVPRVDPIRGLDGASQPISYPRSTGGGADYAAAPADYAGAAAEYSRPAADPYRHASSGSSALAAGSALPSGSVTSSYQVPAAASAAGYQPVSASYPGPAASTTSYSGPASPGGYSATAGGPVTAYPASGGSASYAAAAAAGPTSYPPAATSIAGYLPPAAGAHDGYVGDPAARGSYPASARDSGGYSASALDTGTYQAPLSTAGLSASGGYPSSIGSHQAAVATTGSYSYPAGNAGYAAGQPDQPSGYSGYSGSGASSGPSAGPASGSYLPPDPAYLPPDPGYLAGGYPADQPDARYPLYPAPVPAGQTSTYQSPSPQLPDGSAAGPERSGFGDGFAAGSAYAAQPSRRPEAAYRPGTYDPPGYRVPAPEAGGYAGADPYAVDPDGYTGYGNGGY